MIEVLDDLSLHPPMAQPADGATHAPKIDKAEALIDFTRDAHAVERQVRAFNPWPGAFFVYAGERFRVHACHVEMEHGGAHQSVPGELIDDSLAIACGRGAIRPSLIQRAGKGAMLPGELLRGFEMKAGTRVDG